MSLIVNGEEINDEVIEAEFHQIKGHFERTLQVSCCERDPEFKATAKDNLISRALLNQTAMKRFPEVPEEDVTARLNRLIDEAGGETQFYVNIGMPSKDEAAVRVNVANGVRLDKMLAEVYEPEPTPSEEELQACYKEHAGQFKTPEEVHAAHITKSLQGASSRDEVYKVLREVREKLVGGAEFMPLAEEHRSDDQQQIDLGWFKKGEFMEEFETIVFSMSEGEISPVFQTQLGFHVCTVLGRRGGDPIPFEEVREQVTQLALNGYRDQKFEAFLKELKEGAEIEDNEPEDEFATCGN